MFRLKDGGQDFSNAYTYIYCIYFIQIIIRNEIKSTFHGRILNKTRRTMKIPLANYFRPKHR